MADAQSEDWAEGRIDPPHDVLPIPVHRQALRLQERSGDWSKADEPEQPIPRVDEDRAERLSARVDQPGAVPEDCPGSAVLPAHPLFAARPDSWDGPDAHQIGTNDPESCRVAVPSWSATSLRA